MADQMTSATVAIHSLAAEKKARGETVYNFAAGDPILSSHPRVLEAVHHAIDTEFILYSPVAGIPELKKEAAAWMNAQYNCSYTEDNTLVTAGGKFCLFAAMQILLKSGDEVLIPAPYWVSYPQIAELFKATPVILQTEERLEWKLTPETLKNHITPRSKILILNNAGNPTGTLYSKEELKELLLIAKERDLFVISDEVYSHIVYDGKPFISCGELSDNVLIVQSCSKNFAMTGWRVGFAFGPRELIRSMTALQGQSTTGASTVSQWAALAALKHRTEISSAVQNTLCKRRDFFFDTFNQLFHCQLKKPPAGLYAFIPLFLFKTTKTSSEFCTELIAKRNIACIPGIAFGKEGYIRMAFSEEEEMLLKGLKALREVIEP
jgi:aspartate aminotransferase